MNKRTSIKISITIQKALVIVGITWVMLFFTQVVKAFQMEILEYYAQPDPMTDASKHANGKSAENWLRISIQR